VLDNYRTHKHPAVKQWLAANPRYHVHFTPISSSWLNQIEGWFAEITRKRIRGGTFQSVRDLTKAIQDYLRLYNKNPQPFQWVASTSRIILILTTGGVRIHCPTHAARTTSCHLAII